MIKCEYLLDKPTLLPDETLSLYCLILPVRVKIRLTVT